MLARKYPKLVDLLKKTDYNAKITEIEDIMHICWNKLLKIRYPTLAIWSKKLIMMLKYQTLNQKYFTTFDYNKLRNEIIDNKINEKELAKKTDISEFIENTNLNNKIATFATKAELKVEQDKIVKLIYCFSQSIDTLKRLVIAFIFQRGNLKDCLIKS